MSQYPLQEDSCSLSGHSSVRLKLPERRQVQWRDCALDELLPSDHRARVVWRHVETLDLSPLYAKIA
ncbi:MAG: hypothetical protein IT425_03375, partial [Pirellulales bacterium]|nr:hypothetical protein [Pirellulales bacterium]